uniref:NADH-ubiquinone oxidoreductase chain 4 n=1 Tax=Polyacanthorhynchus caballeroi TaxID=178082 RepID=A0A140DJ77_9BILA|nr:NADH dehydrogenase subunit 4 [Polyacanthorhynchus caballeroi]AMK47831.1 NADH dehydrogenase subunit 4 [Polyacanthorhynchus caballeroi]
MLVSGVVGCLGFVEVVFSSVAVGLVSCGIGGYEVEGVSVGFLGWVMGALMVMGAWVVVSVGVGGGSSKEEVVMVVVGLMFCGGLFVASGWVTFLVFYEGSVFPLLVMILLSSGYYERLGSVYYLLVYTLGVSVPLFVYVVLSVGAGGLGVVGWHVVGSGVLMWLVGVAFLVKVPVYGVHGWLPKVHVEAPAWGSMLLAGVMIKMGVFGLWLVSWVGVSLGVMMFAYIMGGCVVCLSKCIMLTDLKQIVAYSSIVHMSMVIMVSLSGVGGGLSGSGWVMMFHGVVSMGLFLMVGGLSGKVGSRGMVLVSGVFSWGGWMCSVMLMLMVVNSAFPFSGNFIGEVVMYGVLVGLFSGLGVMILIMVLMGVVFNLVVMMVLVGREGGLSGGWGIYGWGLGFYVMLGVVLLGVLV